MPSHEPSKEEISEDEPSPNVESLSLAVEEKLNVEHKEIEIMIYNLPKPRLSRGLSLETDQGEHS